MVVVNNETGNAETDKVMIFPFSDSKVGEFSIAG